MTSKNDSEHKKAIWRVLVFKRQIKNSVNTFNAHDDRQVLTAWYLCREELGALVLLPGYSNDEMIQGRLEELADLRGVDLRLDFVFVHEAGDGIEVEIEVDGAGRDYYSICPFCDHEITYREIYTVPTRTAPGVVEIEDPTATCKHFREVSDDRAVIYWGAIIELGRPADLKMNSVEGGPK